jgi:hypothetical protein
LRDEADLDEAIRNHALPVLRFHGEQLLSRQPVATLKADIADR